MAKPYGDDLRCKLLQAYERGEGTLQQLAKDFGVSAAWAWKISAQRKRSGQMGRMEQRRGGRRKYTADVGERVCWELWRNPDLSLAELQQLVAHHCDLHVSIGTLSEVRRHMRSRLKEGTPHEPMRHRSESAAATRLLANGRPDRAAEADFSR
jgi:transposase